MTKILIPAINSEINDGKTSTSTNHIVKESTIEMRGGDTLQVQMSVDGARTIAQLSPRVTVTFYNLSKVINVPAKMLDPTSKERFIQRTLLDNVSGQIHPGQIVALMGPSGYFKYKYLSFFNIWMYLCRKWKNNIIEYISWSSIEWCYW